MPEPADSGGLVLDTNVWINLLATESIEAILRALNVRCFAPEQVVLEIKRHPVTGEPFAMQDHPLRQMSSFVSIVPLEADEMSLFLQIVGAPAVDSLGDGEAAAIAVAVSRGLDLAIDDKKARRIVRERFSQLRTYWTVDLLQSPAVISAFGRAVVDDYFSKALRFGRMHVPRA